MVSVSSLNPFAGVSLGSLGTWGSLALIFFIGTMILGAVGFLIIIFVVNRQYFIKIKTFRLVNGNPTLVGNFCCKEIPFGRAGDKLWRVAPISMMRAFKIIKWLPVGKIQSAPFEFWYWIRKDGEWINFSLADMDEIAQKMNTKFVQEDMRLQRLATDRLLEQRLMDKTFWEKWGNTIMTIVLFLVIAISMVLIFYQFGKVVDALAPAVESQARITEALARYCGYVNATGGNTGVVPVV